MSTAAEAMSRARVARNAGDLARARAEYAAAAEAHREGSDLLGYALAIRHVADILREEERLAEARPLYEETLELYRSNLKTPLLDMANALRPHALLLEAEGDREGARKSWEEAKVLYGALRIEAGVQECAMHLAGLERASRV